MNILKMLQEFNQLKIKEAEEVFAKVLSNRTIIPRAVIESAIKGKCDVIDEQKLLESE